MKDSGWIKLYRDIEKNPLWQDKPFSKGQAWIDLLIMANHSENEFLLGNEVEVVERGSFITSELKLMEKWGWSKSKVRNFMDYLSKQNMIEKNTDKKKTTITLVNYNVYQGLETTKEPQKDHERTTKEPQENHEKTTKRPQKDTNKNDKNIKNDKECKNEKKDKEKEVANATKKKTDEKFFPESEELSQAFIDYLEMRKKARIPTTSKAITLNVNKVRKFCTADDGNLDIELAINIVNKAIENGWRGLFELRDRHGELIKPKVRVVKQDEHREDTTTDECEVEDNDEEWANRVFKSGNV